MVRLLHGLVPLALWCGLLILPSRAADFRVETKISEGKDTEVVSENLTLFRAGKVYDFLTEIDGDVRTENAQISILDAHGGRLVLLDSRRRLRAEMKCDQLVELAASLRIKAAAQTDPLLKFASDPKFTETAGSTGDDLTFSSALMTYHVKTQKATSAEAARQYWEFSDVFARLNVATSPGARPPFPRIAINESLGKRDLVPKEVDVTISRGRFSGKPEVRHSEHLFHWRLLEADQRRIDDVAESLVKYELVDLETYLHPPAEEAKLFFEHALGVAAAWILRPQLAYSVPPAALVNAVAPPPALH